MHIAYDAKALHASYLFLLSVFLFDTLVLLMPLSLRWVFFWFLVESMTNSQKQHLNTGSHRTKTKRMQWQLSAPPLSHMTSCTYIYFTAITFYSYYRCSTFIFISHLFSLSFDSFCSYSLLFFFRCSSEHLVGFILLICTDVWMRTARNSLF